MNIIIPNEPKRTIQVVEWFRPISLLPDHMQPVTIKTIDDNGERWTWWGVVYDWNHRQWFNTEEDGTLTPVTGRVIWWADDIEGPDTPEDLLS